LITHIDGSLPIKDGIESLTMTGSLDKVMVGFLQLLIKEGLKASTKEHILLWNIKLG
jgi:hypothetical protein